MTMGCASQFFGLLWGQSTSLWVPTWEPVPRVASTPWRLMGRGWALGALRPSFSAQRRVASGHNIVLHGASGNKKFEMSKNGSVIWWVGLKQVFWFANLLLQPRSAASGSTSWSADLGAVTQMRVFGRVTLGGLLEFWSIVRRKSGN